MNLITANKRSLQKVITLIVALVMLLVMTTAGITIISGSTLQERIAGNQRHKVLSRLNADAALLAAENFLDALHPNSAFSTQELVTQFAGNDGLYTSVTLVGGAVLDPAPAGLRDGTVAWTVDNSEPDSASDQRYIIEYMGTLDDSGYGGATMLNEQSLDSSRKVFRITAWGSSNDNNIESIVEAYYLEASQSLSAN